MAKRETQADFEREMATPIAEAEAVMRAMMDDPNRTEATLRAAMMTFAMDIRKLVNQYLGIPDDTDRMEALNQERR